MIKTPPVPGTLTIQGLIKHFGTSAVLKGFSANFAPGTITGIIGPGGGGKSTLLKIIAGVLDYEKGEIHDPQDLLHHVGLMFQEGALFDSWSTIDNVAFPLTGGRLPVANLGSEERDIVFEKAYEALRAVGLKDHILKMPAQLSGGMRKRVSLARALVSEPRLLLLDDPTAGLDPVASSVIMELIVSLHNKYKPTTIIVSHDLRRLLPVVDKIIALFDGKARFIGDLQQLHDFDSPNIRKFVSCRYDIQSEETVSS